MTGWNEAFPYAVDIATLYSTAVLKAFKMRTWEGITEWLDDTLPGEWEYFNGEFRFATERAKMLFLLRWS